MKNHIIIVTIILWKRTKEAYQMQLQGVYVPCAMKIESKIPSSFCENCHPLGVSACPRTFSVYPSSMFYTPGYLLLLVVVPFVLENPKIQGVYYTTI